MPSRILPKPQGWDGLAVSMQRCKNAYQHADYEQAEDILLDILALAPHEAKAWAWLGKVQQRLNKSQQAEDSFRRASHLLRQQSVRSASVPLARLLWQQGQRQAADDMLHQLYREGELTQHALAALRQSWEGEPD